MTLTAVFYTDDSVDSVDVVDDIRDSLGFDGVKKVKSVGISETYLEGDIDE
jgi:hypothetical protein